MNPHLFLMKFRHVYYDVAYRYLVGGAPSLYFTLMPEPQKCNDHIMDCIITITELAADNGVLTTKQVTQDTQGCVNISITFLETSND